MPNDNYVPSFNNSSDPVHKLKELLDWLLANQVGNIHQPRPDAASRWSPALNKNPRVAREVNEFRQWLSEIQTPAAEYFEPHW